jgi:hypothetical protein
MNERVNMPSNLYVQIYTLNPSDILWGYSKHLCLIISPFKTACIGLRDELVVNKEIDPDHIDKQGMILHPRFGW